MLVEKEILRSLILVSPVTFLYVSAPACILLYEFNVGTTGSLEVAKLAPETFALP